MTDETTREIAEKLLDRLLNLLPLDWGYAPDREIGELPLRRTCVGIVTAALDSQSAAFAERMDAAREVIELAREVCDQADTTLQVHGHIDHDTPLHERLFGVVKRIDALSSTGTTDTPEDADERSVLDEPEVWPGKSP
jgi:hypothetical protein